MKDNKKILITGSGSGLGHDISKLAKDNGHFLIGIDIKYKDIFSESDDSVDQKVFCDLSDLDSVAEVSKTISKEHKKIDVLINNACGFFLKKLGEKLDYKKLVSNTNINFNSPLILLNNLIGNLNASKNPLVINVSSGAAYGAPFASHYSMSKGALLSLTKAINEEFRINGNIRAVSLIPGTISTGHSLRENFIAITPIPGRDPVISERAISMKVMEIINNSSEYYEEEIVIKPHKKNIL